MYTLNPKFELNRPFLFTTRFLFQILYNEIFLTLFPPWTPCNVEGGYYVGVHKILVDVVFSKKEKGFGYGKRKICEKKRLI